MVSFKKRTKLRKITVKSLNVLVDFIHSKSYLYEDGIEVGNYIYEIDFKRKYMYISDFNINRDCREKGYGSFLGRSMETLARLYRLKTISLVDGASLEGFWKYLGYRKDKHFKDGIVRKYI